MAARPAVKTKATATRERVTKTPIELFRGRESKEIVLAFSGPVGCGLDTAVNAAEKLLRTNGYDVVKIKVSDFIKSAIGSKLVSLPKEDGLYPSGEAGRIERLQDGGNELRKTLKTSDILAEFAIQKIAAYREAKLKETEPSDDPKPERTAFLVDQLKNPAEVALFRSVYRNLFYLVGVLSVGEKRKKRLTARGISAADAVHLIERDRKEPEKEGQQLDKTLELADFFVRNDHPNAEAVVNALKRFIELIHGANGLSPTQDEYGMYVAYAAGLRSACLSRQVGAAILDSRGNVLATGRNDVPRFGGGLYGPEDGAQDARCVKLAGGDCHSELEKRKLRSDIYNIVRTGTKKDKISDKEVAAVIDAVYEDTRIKDLIEFSRAIHAEMDAIVSLARSSTASALGATLFVTTFPCHSCARHIVAAGIEKVYYIEPYEKSLASELHGDSISTDPDSVDPKGDNKRLVFLHFEGVAPRQYLNLFKQHSDRKKQGVAIERTAKDFEKVVPEYLDDYQVFELKVVTHLSGLINPPPPITKDAA